MIQKFSQRLWECLLLVGIAVNIGCHKTGGDQVNVRTGESASPSSQSNALAVSDTVTISGIAPPKPFVPRDAPEPSSFSFDSVSLIQNTLNSEVPPTPCGAPYPGTPLPDHGSGLCRGTVSTSIAIGDLVLEHNNFFDISEQRGFGARWRLAAYDRKVVRLSSSIGITSADGTKLDFGPAGTSQYKTRDARVHTSKLNEGFSTYQYNGAARGYTYKETQPGGLEMLYYFYSGPDKYLHRVQARNGSFAEISRNVSGANVSLITSIDTMPSGDRYDFRYSGNKVSRIDHYQGFSLSLNSHN